MDQEQLQSDVIRPLKDLLDSLKRVEQSIRRKRSIRNSERAMALTDCTRKQWAVSYAIVVFEDMEKGK